MNLLANSIYAMACQQFDRAVALCLGIERVVQAKQIRGLFP